MNKKSTSKTKLDKSKHRPLSANKKGISLIKQSKTQIEAVFKKLYPISLVLYKSSEQIVVNLSYKTKTLKIRLPSGIPTNNLPYFLHRQIYRQECIAYEDPQKALAQTAKTIGFYTQNGDILLDYRISQGIGTLDNSISIKCLKYKNDFTTTPLQKYNILKCLAIGGFSKVYLVRSLMNGKFYALKAISKDFIAENQKQSIITNQKDICKMLDHPFIVKMNHCFQTNNFLCFVLDFCPGGQLFFHLKRIKRMTQEQAKFYFQQIMYGLQYLHQQGIIYRDLKPQNLLIGEDGHIKIADFGLSKAGMDRQPTYSFCGSAQYMPPQMILRTGHSFGVDHYTLGALLYELVTGLPPFYSRDQQQIKRAILQQQLQFPPQIELSTQIKTLLRGLLNKNPKQRLGCMKGIKQILFHPWLQRVKAQDILEKRLIPPFLPDINEFNFDSDQLGDDQQQFTTLLLQDRTTKMQRSPIQGFEYEAQNNLSEQHLNLLKMNFIKNKKSSASPMKLKPSPSLNCLKSNSVKSLLPSKQQLKKSSSMKLMKSTSTNKLSKTMISSPYYSKQNKLKNSYSISNITNPLKNTKIKSTLMKKSIKGLSIKKLR